MSFDDDLRRKIEARLKGPSPADRLRAAEQAAAERRVAPLTDAVAAMLGRMSESAAFVALVGPSPEIKVEVGDTFLNMVRVDFAGRSGTFSFMVKPPIIPARNGIDQDTVRFGIMTGWNVREQLGGVSFYGEENDVTGLMSDIDGVVTAAEDFIAEYLADVAVTSVGKEWLAEGGVGLLTSSEPSPRITPAVAATGRLRLVVGAVRRYLGR